MANDVKVYIALKDTGDRRLIVDGSMSMFVELLRELGREMAPVREDSLNANAHTPPLPCSLPDSGEVAHVAQE